MRRVGPLKTDFDVAIVGSGFAGSLLAIVCQRLGRSVVLVERGAHPRFAIGESSSPLANLLLEEICERYGLDRIRPLAAWGSWQRVHPGIGCGLKRGFTFYGHCPGRAFSPDPGRADQLLVAASPNDEVADTHWYRADFDAFLAGEAREEGAEYLDRTSLDSVRRRADGGFDLEGERLGRPVRLGARFVADASGPRGFLHRALGLREARFPDLPATSGLYAHFAGVQTLEEIGLADPSHGPPYPADDAAVHHVFGGGWIWVLRFNNGITSAGVSATPRLAEELRLSEGQPAWERLLARLPTVARQFEGSRAVVPFVHHELPFRAEAAAGAGWALLPSAAAFVDPLLSTGFPLTLFGVARLARAVEASWGRPAFEEDLCAYDRQTLSEADTSALLVAALFSSLGDFPLFVELTKLYFAAASFAETERRLGHHAPERSFLCADHPVFGPAFRDCCRSALEPNRERRELLGKIAAAIEPIDVAGLSDRTRRNWHPVLASDLVAAAHKLGVGRSEIESLLERSGFFAATGRS
ncbi:MAG TPA: FAD-binding protein [Thermoanaerobaculia bacterium]|nr:FAD-binding protein [Thermoanaerobaculia bacterium]